MGVILYIFAQLLEWFLAVIFGGANIIHVLFSLKWWSGLKAVDKYFYHRALSKDQYGNVRFKVFMNMWMAEKYSKRYYYGDEDDTISYVTAMNYYKNNPKGLLKFVGNVLNKVDNNHLIKAIDNKIDRDFEAVERLRSAGITELNRTETSYIKYIKNVTNKKK